MQALEACGLAFDLLILPYHEFAGINNIVIEIEQAIR
jgi:hypothetical protein